MDDSEADDAEPVSDDPVPNPRRYFNQQLRHLYDRVPFPVRQPFPATPAAVPDAQYTRTLHRNGTNANASTTRHRPRVRWCHSVRTPHTPPPNPLFGNSFLPLLDMPTDGGGDDEGDNDGDENDEGSAKRPKRGRHNDEASGSKDAVAPARSKARKQPTKRKEKSTPPKPSDVKDGSDEPKSVGRLRVCAPPPVWLCPRLLTWLVYRMSISHIDFGREIARDFLLRSPLE